MANDFYNHGSYPAAFSFGSSSGLRAELDSIAAGFDKLPALSGNAYRIPYVNGAGDGLTTSSTFVLNASGNVGIGTAAPVVKLEVSGASTALRVNGTSGTPATLQLSSAGVAQWNLSSNQDSASEFSLSYSGTRYLTVTSGGSFGIGTSNPSSLNVQGGPILAVSGTGATFVLNDTAASSRWTLLGRTGASTSQFRIYDAVAAVDRLVIDASTGNMGVGTNAPESRLDVAGSAPVLTVRAGVAGSAEFNLRGNGQAAGQALYIAHDASQNAYFWNRSNAAVLLGTNNAERMRLDASGNVGIGTASVPAGRRLAVAGGAVRLDNDAQIEFGGATAGLYGNSTNNTLSLFTATTERMRITASGGVVFVPMGAPAGPQEGEVYYDSSTKKHYGWNGTAWNAFY